MRGLIRTSLAVLSLGLVGCVSQPQLHERVLRIGVLVTPNSLSPLLATNTTENMLNRLVFDTLTSVTPDGRHVPILAETVPTLENHGISADGLTVTFHLRHNIHWHDGVLFTSRDVAFTFHAIMDPHNNVSSHSGFNEVSAVRTPNPFTISFRLKRRFAPIIDALFGESDSPYTILPAHILEKEPNLNLASFNAAPIGTGPFRFVTWQRGDHIEYQANPGYFQGKPRLDRIIVKIIPNENTEISSLQAHDIDWFFEPSAATYPTVLQLHNFTTTLTNRNEYAGLLMNTARPLLRERIIRQAIAAAIDKPAIVKSVTYNSAEVADQDLPPWQWASPHRSPAPSSLGRAHNLLTQAGFTKGQDAILIRGKDRLAFTLTYAEGNATSRVVAVILQDRLRQVGIEVTIHPTLPSLLFAPASMGGVLARGSYDLNLSGWISGVDPDNSTQFSCWARPPQGSNVTRLCTPAMDAAQQLALSSYTLESRKRAYARIEGILSREIPEIFLYYPRGIQTYSPAFMGFAPNSVTESWNAFQWTTSSPTTRQ